MIRYAVYVIHGGRECAVEADGTLRPVLYYNEKPNYDALDILLWRDSQTFDSMGAVPCMIICTVPIKWCIYSVQRFWRVGGMWSTVNKVHPVSTLFDKVMVR